MRAVDVPFILGTGAYPLIALSAVPHKSDNVSMRLNSVGLWVGPRGLCRALDETSRPVNVTQNLKDYPGKYNPAPGNCLPAWGTRPTERLYFCLFVVLSVPFSSC